jgi:hypothetical protein
MSKRLEEFIKMNRDEFDDLEPSADLWEKIEKHLPAGGGTEKRSGAKTFSLGFVLRVAATIVLVMGVGFVLYLRNEKRGQIDMAAINPLYAQQQVQYTSLIETKRSELKTMAKADPQLYQEFSSEIAKMDSAYKKLNDELAGSPNQEKVLHAMIRNLQLQTEILGQQLNVAEQFNKMKQEQKNESKNI